jgi:hypothetical protein
MSTDPEEKLINTQGDSSSSTVGDSTSNIEESGQSSATAASAISDSASSPDLGKPRPSEAYIQSKRITKQRSTILKEEGKGPDDFDFMSDDDLENPAVAGKGRASRGVKVTAASGTGLTKMRNQDNHTRAVGKRTACMACCLTSFGLAMIITSFVLVNQIKGAQNAFYLFLIIGVVAIIPGSYASYNVIGNLLGWYVPLKYFFLIAFILVYLDEI